MILASGEGQVVFLVIMAVIGVINWISGKLNAGNKKAPPGPSPSAEPRRANADSEEERMRRFLEALGIPADERPAPRPVPPIVAPAPFAPAPRRSAATPPPLQSGTRVALSAPVTRAESIALPDLTIPSVSDFETVSSRIAAMPMEFPATRDESDRPHGPTMSETLRAALASPQQLRSAFILTEVFGTPPGLRQPTD